MTESDLPRQRGPWTEADYWALGETGLRIELMDGYLSPSPAPPMPHQDVAHLLLRALRGPARRAGYRAYGSVLLRLGEGRLLVPDLVVAEVDRLAGYADAGDTVLVGEIIQPGNPVAETPDRIEACAAAGIEWLLLAQPETTDHHAISVRLFRLRDGRYLEHLAAGPGDTLVSDVPFSIRVRTGDLVAF